MKTIYSRSLIHSIILVLYISVVSTIMSNGDKLFGEMQGFLAPVAFLLLFTLSALITGALILGKPLMLYLDGKKKEAIFMLLSSIGWLAAFTVIAMLVLIIK